MREAHVVSPAVVVGIDGSRPALNAALWAVDEAVSRDVPLRLTYVIAPRHPSQFFDHQDAARDLATAEIAVRTAFCAVESLERPVKVEVEILQDHPTRALMNASRSAEMLCLGALGLNQATGCQVGSTAAALSMSAHCPLAIVRNHRPAPPAVAGWVVSELDSSADGLSVLELAVKEARLRDAPLRVLTSWQTCPGKGHDGDHTVADNDRQARAQARAPRDPLAAHEPRIGHSYRRGTRQDDRLPKAPCVVDSARRRRGSSVTTAWQISSAR